MSMHIVLAVVAIVPYRHEAFFIQTHHPYKLHSWYLYIKNKCEFVGDDVFAVGDQPKVDGVPFS